MYLVYSDKQLIHDLNSEDNVLVEPTLELELNKAGTFTFSMECTHPFYDKLERFKSIIQVIQDGDELFKGRIIEITDNLYKRRTVYCESELAYLNDSIQRPHEYHLAANAVVEYLNAVIGSHNEQVEDDRQFTVGMTTVDDPNDYIYCYTNYNSTMDEIKEDLVDDLGGYVRIRNDYKNNDPLGELNVTATSNGRFIDYIKLEDYGNTSTQYIEFGENLLDFSSDINQADICTGIIPLGATLDESEYAAIEERVTIKSVTEDGSDYLVIPEAVEKYGLILKVVTWDDITEPKNLLAAAENYLANYDYEPQTITATAVDLNVLNDRETYAGTLTVDADDYESLFFDAPAGATIVGCDASAAGYTKGTDFEVSSGWGSSGQAGRVYVRVTNNTSRRITFDVSITVSIGYESWRLGDMIFVESEPHDLHKRYPLAQMTIPLDQPENTSVTLGTYEDTSLSARTNKTETGLRNMEDFTTGNIIASAVAQATNILNGAIHGYVTLNLDDDGHPYELLIMDTEDTSTATKVWRWNMGGLGYSSTGYDKEDSAYTTAITMDGHILGTLIIANGMVLADDTQVTFGHFDSEGMKIYRQAGQSDELELSITQSGMTVYESSREANFSSGSVTFSYGDTVEGRMYAPGGRSGLILELSNELVLQNTGDGDDFVSFPNQNTGYNLEIGTYSNGYGGVRDPQAQMWLVCYHEDDHIALIGTDGFATYIRGSAISLNNQTTVYGSLTVESGITSNGNNVLTTASSKSIKFQNDNGNTTVSIPFTTATTTVDIQALFDKYALTSALDGYATQSWVTGLGLSSFRNDVPYATTVQKGTITIKTSSASTSGDFSFYSGVEIDISDLVGGGFEDATLTLSVDGESVKASGTIQSGGSCEINLTQMLQGALVAQAHHAQLLSTSTSASYSGDNLYADCTDSFTSFGMSDRELRLYGTQITLNGSTIHSSDQRLKTSIQPLNTSSLDNLTPVSFKWRDGDDKTHYGYIAQEVQPYFPELVSEGTDGMLGLAYTEIIPLLHCKIKEQQEKIDSLEERIARLEELINELT